ncbi:LysR family transcriptional regulator [Arthrobacter monumenti]
MIDPERLSLLLEFDRLGTLTRVAEARFLSTSGVSQQLAVLEREAGVRLLERHGRRVRLTEEGALLVRHGHGILASIEAAETDLQASRTKVAGTIRIGAFSSGARALLPRTCNALDERFPDLNITVSESESHESLRRLAVGDIDVAVVDSFAEEPLIDESLVGELLMKDRLLAVLPPGHPRAKARSIRIEELAEDPWLLEESKTYLGAFVQRACVEAGFRPSVVARFHNADVGLAFVAAGRGVTVLPELAVTAVGPDIVTVPLAPATRRRIIAVVRRTNQRRPGVQAVVAGLKSTSTRLGRQEQRDGHETEPGIPALGNRVRGNPLRGNPAHGE